MEIEPFDIAGVRGRDFVIYDVDRQPKFEGRLLDGTSTLKILWTENVAWTPYWLRKVQRLAGGPGLFDSIEGFATDEFAIAIQSGRVDESEIANRIMRALGGSWAARITRLENWIGIILNRIGE